MVQTLTPGDTITYDSLGTGLYTICLFTSTNGAYYTEAVEIENYGFTSTLIASPNSIFCNNSSVTLSVSNNQEQSPLLNPITYSYKWFRDTLALNVDSLAPSIYHTNTVGLYSVTITNDGGCKDSLSLLLNHVPAPAITINQIPPAPIDSAQLMVDSGFVWYRWYLNGNMIPNSNTNNIAVNETGTYTCMAYDSCGQVAIDSIYFSKCVFPDISFLNDRKFNIQNTSLNNLPPFSVVDSTVVTSTYAGADITLFALVSNNTSTTKTYNFGMQTPDNSMFFINSHNIIDPINNSTTNSNFANNGVVNSLSINAGQYKIVCIKGKFITNNTE
jgi:hypothetical protein